MTPSRGVEAVTAYDAERAAGPDCLGRSVLVSPGQPPPEPWDDCPRVRVSTGSPDAQTGRRLRAAWQSRERLVIELDGPLPGAEPALDKPWWELGPGLTLTDEVWHHLLTANAVDRPRPRSAELRAPRPGPALGARPAG